jgi:diaminopimelate decarboxylase
LNFFFLHTIDKDVLMSVDSVSQLERYGKLNRGGKIAVRFNQGIGTEDHDYVIIRVGELL